MPVEEEGLRDPTCWDGSLRAPWSLGEGMVRGPGLWLVGSVCCCLLPPVGVEREGEDGG